MRRNRIVYWLGEPSPHISGYLRVLPDLLPDGVVIGVFQRQLPGDRLAMGWRTPEAGRMEVFVAPPRETIERIALTDPERTVHIFGGLRLPLIKQAMAICTRTTALIGLSSEARDWRGYVGTLRLLHSRFSERRHRGRIDFVLAIGHLAQRWYEMCGYAPARIFRWTYVVERETVEAPPLSQNSMGRGFSIVFVGQCIQRKGIDVLLRALSELNTEQWSLLVIGDGALRSQLEDLATELRLAGRVEFLGVRNNGEVKSILGRSDLLVLPSRFDGWGAVINEALMSGVPVVCSDRCGAADLVRANGYGETFIAGSVTDLARALRKWITKGALTADRRSEIQEWSRCIAGESAARYLVEIVANIDEGAARPVAPWLRERSSAGVRSSNAKLNRITCAD